MSIQVHLVGNSSAPITSDCGICQGLIMQPGIAYGWGGKICYCANPNVGNHSNLGSKVGWICPKCNSGVAPHKEKCC